jgi:hypothetical protein
MGKLQDNHYISDQKSHQETLQVNNNTKKTLLCEYINNGTRKTVLFLLLG